jgi:sulfatase modifying factor 1
MPRSNLAIFFSVVVSIAAIPLFSTIALPSKAKGTNYAFLVACAGYDKAELQPIKDDVTINDILEFKKALLETGFEEANITLMHDKQTDRRFLSEHAKIVKQLDLFLDGMKPEDTALLVLSGHGVLFAGDKTGYFCPVDARISAKSQLIPMDGPGSIYEQLGKCKAGRKLLIANACRNDPLSSANLSGEKIKLADDYPENVPKGIAAIYSCEAGQKSYFDSERKRSLFFIHLTEAWRGKYVSSGGPLTLESIFEQTCVKTKADAAKTFGEKQYPVVRRQYEGEWVVARDLGSVKEPKAGEEREFEIAAGVKMKFCWIPAGEAQLGSLEEERNAVGEQKIKFVLCYDLPKETGPENPNVKRRVEMEVAPKSKSESASARGVFTSKGFWLGKYPVTQKEWHAVVGDNPSYFDLDDYRLKKEGIKDTSLFPVESVRWNDCQTFLKKLNDRRVQVRTTAKFVLPHEDQWEFACRGGKGNRQPYYWGYTLNGQQANCDGKHPFGTSSSGIILNRTCSVDFTNDNRYEKHPWGLCHINGNVWQWCANQYEETSKKVIRGGSYDVEAKYCRSATRLGQAPEFRHPSIGFRVCLVME